MVQVNKIMDAIFFLGQMDGYEILNCAWCK